MLKDDGPKMLADVKTHDPGVKIIIETIGMDYTGLIEGVRLGADAYLPISPTTAQTMDIIRRVAGNHSGMLSM